jgi:proton-coupled amino acid transporter
MAKELGLQNQRQPRKQVRAPTRTTPTSIGRTITRFVQDSTFEDARMRAVYSSHTRLEEEDDLMGTAALLGRMHASWAAQDFDDLGVLLEEDLDEEMVEDPHAAGLGGTLTSAVLGIIKGMVGPAILYLPHGFAGAGYAVAIPIMLCATAMFLYASRCLLDAWKHESEKGAAGSTDELSSLMAAKRKKRRIILSYPELAYRALGSTGEAIVKTGIALMQSGVCLTYLIFVPQNLHASLLILTGIDIAPELWLIVMIGIQIPLSWIRDIRKLTPTNFVANALILYGLLLCLGFAFVAACKNDQGMGPLEIIGHRLTHLDPFNDNWFLFIGTSVRVTFVMHLQRAISSL